MFITIKIYDKMFNKYMKVIILSLIAIIIITGIIIFLYKSERPIDQTASPVNISNPASDYCIEKGGIVVIKKMGNGSEYGMCDFGDARYCEEWALFRGECPIGGVKLTGYENEAQRFCAMTGGDVNMENNTCSKNGKKCDIDLYYNGKCQFK